MGAAADPYERGPHYAGFSTRGARRRTQLLTALDELLADRSIEEIEIADITGRAGVTRSLFYFYFSGIGGAVMALAENVLTQIAAIASEWQGPADSQRERLNVAITQAVTLWRRHARFLAALLQAMPADPAARDRWETWCAGFAERARLQIEYDQARGTIEASLDARPLAEMLTGMTTAAMEREIRAIATTGEPLPGVADTLTHIWYRSLYGRPTLTDAVG